VKGSSKGVGRRAWSLSRFSVYHSILEKVRELPLEEKGRRFVKFGEGKLLPLARDLPPPAREKKNQKAEFYGLLWENTIFCGMYTRGKRERT